MKWLCDNCCSEWAEKICYDYYGMKKPINLCWDCYETLQCEQEIAYLEREKEKEIAYLEREIKECKQ